MPRWLSMLLGAGGGYVLAAVIGFGLVQVLSANRHDRSVEAAMTALFVAGPLGAIAGAVWAWLRFKG